MNPSLKESEQGKKKVFWLAIGWWKGNTRRGAIKMSRSVKSPHKKDPKVKSLLRGAVADVVTKVSRGYRSCFFMPGDDGFWRLVRSPAQRE